LINVIWDQGFKKAYKKRFKNDENAKSKFWEALELFSEDPFDRKLRTHKLSGKLDGLWALSCAFDCRVIFKFVGKCEVLLIDIGGHEEVY
jgi:addiction module RelE/StbE family toxin